MEHTTTQPLNPEYRGRLRRLCMLVRREFWEHRVLWGMPAILVGLALLFSTLALIAPARINANLQGQNQHIVIDGESTNLSRLIPGLAHSGINVQLGDVTVGNLLRFFGDLPTEVRGQFLKLALIATAKLLLMPLGFLALVLSLNVLRRETRSRSIYFFKSMPMNEVEMIGAKLLAFVPVLLGVMLATIIVSHLVTLAMLSVAALFAGLNPWTLIWAPAPLLASWGYILRTLALDYLWFLPTVGFFFALNAWHDSRRLAAVMAVVAVAVVDRLYLTGGGLWHWLGQHVVPPGWAHRGPQGDVFTEFQRAALVDSINWPSLLSGVAIGLALLWASTWLLRWKEER